MPQRAKSGQFRRPGEPGRLLVAGPIPPAAFCLGWSFRAAVQPILCFVSLPTAVFISLIGGKTARFAATVFATVVVFGITLVSCPASALAGAAAAAPVQPPATGQTDGSQGATAVGALAAGDFLSSLSAAERAWLHDHPAIRVAQDPSWPPIEFTDERGVPSGMTGDYLKLIAGRLGLAFERVPDLSWQEAYARLKRWEIDMTTTVAVTPEREAFWAFTKPYMTIPIVIVTRADVAYIADLRELAGKKVVVVDGYVASVWIPRDLPEIQLVRVKTTREALAMLQRGDVFACVENMLVVGHHMAELKLTDLKIAGSSPYTNAQCMAVRKDWAILAGILDKALDSVSATEREAIYRRWLPVRHDYRFDYARLWPVAALFAGVLLGLAAWNWRLAREIRQRKQAEAALHHTQALLQSVTEGTSDAIYVKDVQGRYLMFNAAAARLVGKPSEEVLGQDDTALFAPDEARQVMEGDRGVMASGSVQTYEEFVTSGGVARTFLSAKGPLRDAQGMVTGLFGIARDITERKRAEEALRRTERALRMTSECNRALVHAADEVGLLQAICRITVEHGGYRMAWVGFAAQDEAKSVRPVAQAGFEAGYLDTVNITWADTERGRGPTGTAIRTGRSVIARDIPTDPAFGPWRAAASQRGYASSATLPLTSAERTFGALMVYAAEPDAFNGEEVALLTELAGDLAYGITALRTSVRTKQAEAALRASEEEFHSLAEAMPQIVWVTRPDGSNIYFNQQWVDYTGLTLQESYGHGWNIPFHADDRQRASAAWQQATASGGTYALECRLRRADGAYRWWLVRGVPLRDAAGRVLKWFGTCTDIEDIKQVEAALRQKAEALRASNAELESFNRAMVGRELRMIELKQEINELCRRLGEPPRHETSQSQTDRVSGADPASAPPGGGGA